MSPPAPCSRLQVPAVNSSWMGDFVRQYHNVDVNVAVASPAGLMVPFVRDADRKGLLAISEEVKGLAAKVCTPCAARNACLVVLCCWGCAVLAPL